MCCTVVWNTTQIMRELNAALLGAGTDYSGSIEGHIYASIMLP